MSNPTSSFAFTTLVGPSGEVTQSLPPAPFDAGMAYLLGLCCGLSYTQFDTSISVPNFSSLSLLGSLTGYAVNASNFQPFTASEANEPGAIPTDAGDYFQVPAGFGVELTLTPPPSSKDATQNIIVIALRGTRTWDEWLNDGEAFPVPFAGKAPFTSGLGSVHAGFYGHYTIGTNGATVPSGKELDPTLRESKSIAGQVGSYVTTCAQNLPVYITGHSLGGALATLAALDIATNFKSTFSELYMYSLASPRVAAGMAMGDVGLFALGNQELFVSNYQKYVPNSYQIVHAADIVPILPPLSAKVGPLTVNCAQVTDAYPPGSSSSLTGNVINFCAQTGDLAGNHSCSTYLWYLEQLAGNFQPS
ncbi:MAG: lipase family protein [Acidobacteriota bacterium]